MSRKKEANIPISEEDTVQVQHILDHYQQIAQTLRESTNQSQAEAALDTIHTLTEAVQMTLPKALARINDVDAADLLLAINTLNPHKEVRKEARRALIRLEATKTYPQWQPPIMQAPAIQVNIAHPARFWKGFVTQTREEGGVQLFLFWEQGYDYSEARVLIFALDFWQEGIREALMDLGSKRHINENFEGLRANIKDAPLVECTLVEGKRLLEEALSVNEWRGTAPHQEYRNRLPLIHQLIMQTTDSGEDRGLTLINPALEDQEVVINFVGAWSMGDYGLAYDLLSQNSSIRDGLPRYEWITRHRAWADEAHPTRIQLGFVHERERSQSALWLPSSPLMRSRAAGRKELEIGWSLELLDTPLSGVLKEMPMGTAINKETGRHWFWTSYTLIHEQDAWRIQQATDEGANVQGLAIPELQKRIEEYNEAINTRVKQRDTDANEVMEELSWRITQLLHYDDALIARLPLDREVCQTAYAHAVGGANPERAMVYVERLAYRFAEDHSDMLRRFGATVAMVAANYDMPEMQDRYIHLITRAEAVLREAVATENSASNHLLLAELLLNQQRYDESEAELRQAQSLPLQPNDEASVEAAFGNIAMRREQLDVAKQHYQRVTELDPSYPGVWFSLGFTQRLSGNFAEAEIDYQRALQAEPRDIRAYTELIAVYMNQQRKEDARTLAERAVGINPDSAQLRALYASVLFDIGDTRTAQHELAEAEKLDPEAEIVKSVREHINSIKHK